MIDICVISRTRPTQPIKTINMNYIFATTHVDAWSSLVYLTSAIPARPTIPDLARHTAYIQRLEHMLT